MNLRGPSEGGTARKPNERKVMTMKKWFVLFLAVLTLCTVSCGKTAETPGLTDEEARTRLAELLPDARQVMRAAYGEGLLPVEGAEPRTAMPGEFFPVREGEAYSGIAELRAAAERAFSTAYLRDNLFVLLFEGYESPEETGEDETVVTGDITPRYVEENGVFMVDVNYTNYGEIAELLPETAEVLSGNAGQVRLSVSYRIGGVTAEAPMRITMVKENGVWMLDGPVY